MARWNKHVKAVNKMHEAMHDGGLLHPWFHPDPMRVSRDAQKGGSL